MATKAVLVLLFAEFCQANLLSCKPQKATKAVNGSTAVFKTVMTKKAFSSMCKHSEVAPIKGDAQMQSDCNEFCKITDGGISVPLLLGAEGFGFNHAEMDSLCHGNTGVSNDNLVTNDPPAFDDCKLWSQAVPEIKFASQNFQIEKKKMEIQQGIFRSQVAAERKILQKKLSSQKFRQGFDSAIDKPGYIHNEMLPFKSKTKGSVNLREAMTKLVAQGTKLNDVVVANLAIFKQYLQKCNRLLLTRGSLNEYLLDICARGNDACIEDQRADRVGCCCGVNPLALGNGNFRVEGFKKWSKSPNLGRAARRLSGLSDLDTCAEIKRQTREDTKAGYASVVANGDQKTWDKDVETAERRYPVYAKKCTLNEQHRRRRGVPPRQLARDASDQNGNHGEVEVATRVQNDNISHMSDSKTVSDVSRKLQDNNCAKPPKEPNGHKELFVAVPANAPALSLLLKNRKVNGVEGALDNDTSLLQICENFCDGGVPFLVGSKDMGLNLSGANRICLPPVDQSRSSLLKYDRVKLDTCKSWAITYNEVTWESAAFQREEAIFDAVKLEFETQVASSVKALQTYMQSKEFEDIMDAAGRSSKMKEFEKALKDKLAKVKDSSALTQQAAKLEKAAEKLQLVVAGAQVALKSFLAECDDLFLATGSQGEYLLDFGATTGQYCIDNDAEASHATCCCGFNPVSLLGQHSISAPILGLQAEAGGPYATGEKIEQHYKITLRRKLATKVDEKEGVDFCAQSWTDNMKNTADIYRNILEIGGGENVLALDKKKKDRYNQGGHKDYCSPFSCGPSRCLLDDVRTFTMCGPSGCPLTTRLTTKKAATTKKGADTSKGSAKKGTTAKKGADTSKGSAKKVAKGNTSAKESSTSHTLLISPMISAISASLVMLFQIA